MENRTVLLSLCAALATSCAACAKPGAPAPASLVLPAAPPAPRAPSAPAATVDAQSSPPARDSVDAGVARAGTGACLRVAPRGPSPATTVAWSRVATADDDVSLFAVEGAVFAGVFGRLAAVTPEGNLEAQTALDRGMPRARLEALVGAWPSAAWLLTSSQAGEAAPRTFQASRWLRDRWASPVRLDDPTAVSNPHVLGFGAWRDGGALAMRDDGASDVVGWRVLGAGAGGHLPSVARGGARLQAVASRASGELFVALSDGQDRAWLVRGADEAETREAMPPGTPCDSAKIRSSRVDVLAVARACAVVVGGEARIGDASVRFVAQRACDGAWQVEAAPTTAKARALSIAADGAVWLLADGPTLWRARTFGAWEAVPMPREWNDVSELRSVALAGLSGDDVWLALSALPVDEARVHGAVFHTRPATREAKLESPRRR